MRCSCVTVTNANVINQRFCLDFSRLARGIRCCPVQDSGPSPSEGSRSCDGACHWRHMFNHPSAVSLCLVTLVGVADSGHASSMFRTDASRVATYQTRAVVVSKTDVVQSVTAHHCRVRSYFCAAAAAGCRVAVVVEWCGEVVRQVRVGLLRLWRNHPRCLMEFESVLLRWLLSL